MSVGTYVASQEIYGSGRSIQVKHAVFDASHTSAGNAGTWDGTAPRPSGTRIVG